MLAAMTRQDLMSVTQDARNKIIERLVTKYDVQTAADSARDRILSTINALHLENQAQIRQSNAQKDQIWRKILALESQMIVLQQEIKSMNQTLARLYGVVPRTR
jgi:hypothetical protein